MSGKWQLSCILQSGLDISNTLRLSLSPITPRWDSCRKTSSGLPLILHYGELCNYFIIYYNIIIIEIKCTINVMLLNHPEIILPLPRSMQKLSSTKLVPGAKNVGDCCSRQLNKNNHILGAMVFFLGVNKISPSNASLWLSLGDSQSMPLT